MTFKDIAVFTFSPKQDEAALALSERLAGEPHISAVLLEIQPNPAYTMDGMILTSLWTEVLEEARKGFAKDEAELEARRRKGARDFDIRILPVISGIAETEAAVHARHADLSVMMRPGGEGVGMSDYRNAIFEGVLFDSGRPVLLAPPNWDGAHVGKRVLIAWNGKRESARAIADAMPLLQGAEQIKIVIIDAKPTQSGVGPAPGEDIAAHLARCGLEVELRHVDGLGRPEADTLIAEAQAMDADLIVMGGYGRARLSEMVFGGMTRAMIEIAPIPVFMSH